MMKKVLLLALCINQSFANDFVFKVNNFNDYVFGQPYYEEVAKLCKLQAGDTYGYNISYLDSNNEVINNIINYDIPSSEMVAGDISERFASLLEGFNEVKDDDNALEFQCGMMSTASESVEVKDLGNYQGFIQIAVEKHAYSVNGSGVHSHAIYIFDQNNNKLSLKDFFDPKAYPKLQSALLPKLLAAKKVKNVKACQKSPACSADLPTGKAFSSALNQALVTDNFYFDAKGNLHFVYSYHENEYHQPNPLVSHHNPELELVLSPSEYQSALKK